MLAEDRIPRYRPLSKHHHKLTDSPASDEDNDEDTSLDGSHLDDHSPEVTQLYHQNQNRKEREPTCRCQRILTVSTCLLLVLSLFLLREYQLQQDELARNAQHLAKMGVSFQIRNSLNSTLLSPKLMKILTLQEHKKVEDSHSEAQILPNKVETSEKELSSTQPTIWIFDNELNLKPDIWNNLTHRSLLATAAKTGHRVVVLSEKDWQKYLQQSKVKRILRFFGKKLSVYADESSGLDIEADEADQMKHQIILLEVLQQHGGIILKSGSVVTEDFSWLDTIHMERICNSPKKAKKAEVFGFHSQRYSPQPAQQDIPVQEPAQRYMIRFPSLTPYFLKAEKNSDFLKDFLKTIYKIISEPESFEEMIQRISSQIPTLKGQIQLRKLYYLCSQIVLREREEKSNSMALEYYNLATVNENLGPKKLQFILGAEHSDRIFTHLSLISLEELEQQFGQMRFFSYFDPYYSLAVKFKKGLSSSKILLNSFIHTYFFQRQSHPSLFAVEVDPNPAINDKWQTLPKKIWSFVSGKLVNSTLLTQLWVEHVRMRAKFSGFQFIILNQDNIDRYVSIELLAKIESTLRKGINIYEDTRMRLFSLAVMLQQGGVWIDPLTILTENLNWVHQGYKDFKIWNRFGTLPKVVLPFHPQRGGPFSWKHSQRSNGSKEAWHLGYQYSLIASQPFAEIMKIWFEASLRNVALTYQQLQSQFQKSGISDYLWIRPQNTQLFILDTLKHQLAVKQSQLYGQLIATDIYKIRALNGFMGSLKMGDSFNFIQGAQHQNSFLWTYSQKDAEGMIGPFFYPIKIPDSTASAVNQILIQTTTWHNHIHNKSILANNLLKSGQKIVNVDGRMVLQKNINENSKTNWPKLIWLYLDNELGMKDPLSKRNLNKVRQIAKQGGFQVRIVNGNSYKRWLNAERADYMQSFISQISKRLENQKSNFKDHYQSIKQRYILLNLLFEMGGIMINRNIILLEDFTWLNQVQSHPFASQGEPITPQVFGFYTPSYSSEKQEYGNHYLVKYPALEDFFIAAVPNSDFIGDTLIMLMQIAQDSNFIKDRLNIAHSGQLRGKDPYYQIFFLSCQLAIQEKQKELDSFDGKLAVSHYGLVTINTLLYPYKLPLYFDTISSSITMRHFTDLPLAQLEKFTGPLRYLTVIPKFKDFKNTFEKIDQQDSNYYMVQRCFMHSHFYANQNKANIVSQGQVEIGLDWNIPKNVWYQPTEASTSGIIQKILSKNIDAVAKSSQFALIGLNQQNIREHIDDKDLKLIESILQKSQNEVHRESLYRLAVLKHKGGVFIGRNWLINEGFQWITNIGKIDSRLIFNRIGSLPKTLMLYNSLKNQWAFNSSVNSLVTLSPIYTVDFIATEPNTKLLAAWFDKFVQLAQLKDEDLKRQLANCGNFKNWQSFDDQNKLASEALTCLLAQFQKNNPGKSSSEAFGIWSISESVSANKLSKHLDFLTESTLSPFLWQYSKKDSEMILGNLNPFIRITPSQINQLSSKLIEWGHTPWGVSGSLLQQLQSRLSVSTPLSPKLP